MSENLKKKTFKGIQWNLIATVVTSILQIFYTGIMARLLDPADFGLVALANLALRFGSYFSKMGMSQAIIQKRDLQKNDIYSAFTSSIALGLFFFVVIFFFANAFNYFFQEDNLIPVIRVLALSFVISGVFNTASSLMSRSLDFKKLAFISMATYLVSYMGIGIALAYLDFGFWSLIIATLSQIFLTGISAFIITKHPVKLYYNWKVYKPLFEYGSKISIINFIDFLGKSMDTFVIGKILGPTPLGYYNRAQMLILLPFQFFTTSISRVLFSSFSRIQGDEEKLGRVYYSSLVILSFILIPTGFGAAMAANEIILVILGDKWVESIPILQIIALVIPFNFINHLGGVLCDAKGVLNIKIVLQVSFILILAILFFLLKGYGITGFATSVLIAELLVAVFYSIIINRILSISLLKLLKPYLFAIACAIFVSSVIFGIKYIFKDLNDIFLLVLEISFAGLALLTILKLNINKSLNRYLHEYVFDNIKANNRYISFLIPKSN